MVFNRQSALKLTYVFASEPDPDLTIETYLSIPGVGAPRGAYVALKGSAPDLTWPQGAGYPPLYDGSGTPLPYGNTLITDAFSHKYGLKSWQITAEPGLVPGILEVASYFTSTVDDDTPDDHQSYTLDVGGWSTGDLPVLASTGATLYRMPRIRWVPINLASLI